MTSVADKLAKKSERRTSKKQVRLRLVQIDVWSVVKLALLIAACVGVVIIVAAILLWTVLANTGVMESINNLLNDVTSNEQITVETFINFQGVLAFSAILALLEIVVMTALAAIAAFLYNLTVRLTGGIVFGFTNS
ncbi:DUF3566 domain-containing protein [Gulosibacter chungangensis]|uniref:DUF3566 domain-containing protein n=1 Tax=Gulosibacter chungangensis TaxID=979746 RepID=A0A7J5BGH1_9MICO|nr:DUF3566 domain-containing protein [Gulosibacter chungangensis]KAB1645218.1 DUF3566 domain-containing protein [Gulosibacter chungangensis]